MRALPRALALPLAALALMACMAAPDSRVEAREADLDYLCRKLESTHKDLYRRVTPEAFAEKREQIRASIPTDGGDLFFAMQVQCLAAMAGDAHTRTNIGPSMREALKYLPFEVRGFEGAWVVSRIGEENSGQLGKTLVSLNGRTPGELLETLTPFISHDNAVWLREQFSAYLNIVEVLLHFGVTESREAPAALEVEDAAGGRETILLRPAGADWTQRAASLEARRPAVPPTEGGDGRPYRSAVLDGGTFYVALEQCKEDKDLPPERFARQVEEALAGGGYRRVAVDMRRNSGGSDRALAPILDALGAYHRRTGTPLYVLIGPGTFSAAVTNAVQLGQRGAVLAGQPTGGSVDHFGDTVRFTLPNVPIEVRCSTKYLEVSRFCEAAQAYGEGPLTPDLPGEQTLADYLAGVDTLLGLLP